MTTNLRALIHMSGLRLCTMAQWEIRRLFQLIRHEIFSGVAVPRVVPRPEVRPLGYCDEFNNRDEHCPIRPHKDNVLRPGPRRRRRQGRRPGAAAGLSGSRSSRCGPTLRHLPTISLARRSRTRRARAGSRKAASAVALGLELGALRPGSADGRASMVIVAAFFSRRTRHAAEIAAVDEDGAPASRSRGPTSVAPLMRDRSSWDRNTLSYWGRKRIGAGTSASAMTPVLDVEQLAAALVAERSEVADEAGRRPRAGRSATTRSGCPHGRRPEDREVAEDEVVDAAWRHRRAGPRLGGRVGRSARLAPQPARRDLDERQEEPRRIGERRRVPVRASRRQRRTELRRRQRLRLSSSRARVEDGLQVDADRAAWRTGCCVQDARPGRRP